MRVPWEDFRGVEATPDATLKLLGRLLLSTRTVSRNPGNQTLKGALTTVGIRIHTKLKKIRPDIYKSNSLWIVNQSEAWYRQRTLIAPVRVCWHAKICC